MNGFAPTQKRVTSRLASGLLMLSVLLVIGNTASAEVTGTCVSADLAEPVRLPDGSSYPAGQLTLCVSRFLSPVSALHKVYVDRQPVGMLISRRGRSEGIEDSRPFMVFQRSDGYLDLYGFATPGRRHMATYILEMDRTTWPTSFARRSVAPQPAVSSVATLRLTGTLN